MDYQNNGNCVSNIEQFIDDALGYRSPCISLQHAGSTSPGQGRSVREFEEQMASLRKENFNLKLRIYFLEEKIPGYSSSNTDGHESLLKQNVDLKVDIEVLRKELQEKQSLLCEAAKAMELMEQQQKATEEKSKGIIDELNQKIHYLEMENKQLEQSTNQNQMDEIMGRTDIAGDINTIQKVRELEGCLKHYNEKTEELTVKIHELENIINDKDKTIHEFEDKIKQFAFQNAELQEQLDIRGKELANTERKLIEFNRKVLEDNEERASETVSENQALLCSIEKLRAELEYEKISSEERNKKIQQQQKIMQEMQCSRLREELHKYKIDLADKVCHLEEVEDQLNKKSIAYDNACKGIQTLLSKLKKQEIEIERLKEKNSLASEKQIIEDPYGNNSTALCKSLSDSLEDTDLIKTKLDEKNTEINKLKMDVKKTRSNLLTLLNEEICQKNNQIENLTNLLKRLGSSSHFVSSSPSHDANQLQQSFTESEYEAAIDSKKHLQKKVDVLIQRLLSLPELNGDETIYQLKLEINNAREEVEKAHNWRKDACFALTERLEELAGFLNSLLNQKDVLSILAADRSLEMRKSIDRSLDISRNLNLSLSFAGISMTEQNLAQLCNISGLLDMSAENKENKTFNSHKKVDKEESHIIERLQTEIKVLKKELSRSLPLNFEDQTDSEAVLSEPDRNVSLARIGLENSPVINHRRKIEEEKPSTSSESGISRKGKSKSLKKISQNMLNIRDDRLLEVQCELVEADNRLKQENLRVVEITHKLEEYTRVNEMLKAEIDNYKSQVQQYEKQLTCERENLERIVNVKVDIIERTREERDKLNIEVRVAEMKIDTLKKDIDELKDKQERKLEKAAEQEKLKLDQLQIQMNAQLEQKLKEQEDIKYNLEDVQKKFNEAQNTIEYLQENESDLNRRLIENEKSMRNLKKNLDEATLQASKAVLDRTKIQNEKLQLENQVQELIQKLESAEVEKTELGNRLTQLEETNTLLQNSLLNSATRQLKQSKKSSNGSEGSHSGYTSEDVPMPIKGGPQRAENSSPDLGIESDAGRASSVELPGVQNRLLKSIENLDTWKLQGKIDNGNEAGDSGNNNGPLIHDCATAEKEILELRQKLESNRRNLMYTVEKLRKSNQKKEQVQRDIRQQIVKTHDVLKTVRNNLESGLEQNKK